MREILHTSAMSRHFIVHYCIVESKGGYVKIRFTHYVKHYCVAFYYTCVQVQLAAKTSIFSPFCRGLKGLSRSKDLHCDLRQYRGAEDRAKLQGYVSEPLIRSMVDALNDGRKCCLLVYNSD